MDTTTSLIELPFGENSRPVLVLMALLLASLVVFATLHPHISRAVAVTWNGTGLWETDRPVLRGTIAPD